MSQPETKRRPTVKEILSGQELKSGGLKGDMSERDIASMLAPLGDLSTGAFFTTMKVGEALGQQLNLKSAKTVEQVFQGSYAGVVLSLVIALKQSGNEILTLLDVPKGAMIEAKMASDIFSLGGMLTFDVLDQGATTKVIGASEVKGQMFDWGKGGRALKAIYERTAAYLRRFE